MKNKLAFILSLAILLTACAGCGGGTAEKTKTLVIAYQSGVSYAPLIVAKELKLIEKHFDGEIAVTWKEMTSGSAINEGLASGSIDVGAMGVPVAIAGIVAGSPIRFCFGLSAQPFALMTNVERIHSLADITSSDQIALPNVNSVQHILLAMAARSELGDAHALDGNLVALSNPDGYSAIVSGAVACHFALSPYNFMEERSEDASIHPVDVGKNVWPVGNTVIAAVALKSLVETRHDTYAALLSAVEEAMAYIKEHPTDAAQIVSKGYDASHEEIYSWMNDSRSVYTMELQGVMDLASFMVEEGFLEKGPASFEELVFENVKGS